MWCEKWLNGRRKTGGRASGMSAAMFSKMNFNDVLNSDSVRMYRESTGVTIVPQLYRTDFSGSGTSRLFPNNCTVFRNFYSHTCSETRGGPRGGLLRNLAGGFGPAGGRRSFQLQKSPFSAQSAAAAVGEVS